MSELKNALKEFFPNVRTLSERPPLEVVKTPWDLLNDYILGCGGVPRGRSIELYAPPSVGKTTLLLNIVGSYIQQGLDCAIDDREGALQEEDYTKGIPGFDRSKIIEMVTGNGNDALYQSQLMFALNGVDLYAIDSVAGILPETSSRITDAKDLNMKQKLDRASMLTAYFMQLRSGYEIGKPGTAKKDGTWNEANMIESDTIYLKDGKPNKFIHKLTDKKTTLFMINHYKQGIGPYAGGSTPGGIAGKFDATIRLRLTQKKKTKKTINGTPAFKIVEIKADKNKVGPPGRAGLFLFHWDGRVEEYGKSASKYQEEMIDEEIGAEDDD